MSDKNWTDILNKFIEFVGQFDLQWRFGLSEAQPVEVYF